jgi:hypothetical protein
LIEEYVMSRTNPIPRGLSMAVIVLFLSAVATGSALAGPQEPVQSQSQSQSRPATSGHQPIVNGHELQPSQSELAKPDVSDSDAKTVDDLYQKLMKEEAARYPTLLRRSTTQ